ncbi:MAG: SRPBCC domain-containing protein [Anaerolineales bacterium]|nr:SRPBCC domain-containing protein [Anaerolineales bacterium]
MSYDWTRFEKQVFIAAPSTEVFQAWAVPNELTRWFIAEANYSTNGRVKSGSAQIESNDQYHWRWHQDLEASGNVREVVAGKQIVFTFGKQSPESLVDVLVTVTVSDEGDGCTKLSLVQENMADTPYGRHYHLSCNLGWSFFMTNLKGLLEHGIDLRETHPERVEAARAISVS